ncbi:hypothetical protein VTJ83DRAFT_3222 [Remersonia thermophila]|uniref:RRM domain-containing protein n=1 Tax=Remersonia thermophila TaxID=72144 RepID=A0ABR4DDE2_9PEZI
MQEPLPEFLATASLSPVSPTPLPAQRNIQASVVPNLQDQAAAGDEAAVKPTPSPPPFGEPPGDRMSSAPVPASHGAVDDMPVDAYPGETHDESDDSIGYGDGDGDGEEAQGEDRGAQQETAKPDATNDDYAKTFDSPAAHEDRSEAEDAQPDVPMAAAQEPTHSPSAPAQAPAPAAVRPGSPSPVPPPSGDAPSQSEPPNGLGSPSAPGPAATLDTAPSTEASTSPAAEPTEKPSRSPAVDAAAAAAAAIPAAAPASAEDNDAGAIDIQKLVDNLSARAAAPAASPDAPAQAPPAATQATPAPSSLSHPHSLPPKPTLSNPPASLPAIPPAPYSHARAHPASAIPPAGPMSHASPRMSHGAYPASDAVPSFPSAGPYGGPPHHAAQNGDATGYYQGASIKQLWEQFQADEKRYTTEARWDRFPEGSRIFIGNLSSERVSKREVFDVFHRFGRLAQISLKSAYGFVQYHTVAEGAAAMQGAQDIELGGRKIHLEVSRVQKKKEDRDRSPDRRGRHERFDSADRGWKRDDYRQGRSPSPRRNDPRGHFGRRRSRSPARFGRYGDDSYRRRSPSPHRRTSSNADQFDLPRRFGPDVPDVQILLLQEVMRDFVSWVQGAFHTKGLRTDVMYLNPRFPRETVVQRLAAEGVHGIVDLDYAAQAKGKIPIQVFNRSGGANVRFELYQDIDPPIAAELVIREKSQSHAAPPPAQPPNPYAQPPVAPYGHPPAGYPAYPYPPHPAAAHPAQPPHAAAPPASQPAQPDLANLVGSLDNQALSALLAQLQSSQAQPAASQGYPTAGAPPAAPAAPQQQPPIDMNALLGNLRSVAAAQQPQHQAQQPGAYPPAAAPGYPSAGVAYGAPPVDAAQQVQSIMEQLKRAAQS